MLFDKPFLIVCMLMLVGKSYLFSGLSILGQACLKMFYLVLVGSYITRQYVTFQILIIANFHVCAVYWNFVYILLSLLCWSPNYFILQERKDWKLFQITELKLVISENYTLMASHTFFKALCILERYLEKIARIKSSLPSGSYKTSLDTSHPPILLSLCSKQINRFKNEVDKQLSSLLDCWPAIFWL